MQPSVAYRLLFLSQKYIQGHVDYYSDYCLSSSLEVTPAEALGSGISLKSSCLTASMEYESGIKMGNEWLSYGRESMNNLDGILTDTTNKCQKSTKG